MRRHGVQATLLVTDLGCELVDMMIYVPFGVLVARERFEDADTHQTPQIITRTP